MPRTLISLGANLGNVRETMKLAQQMLQDEFGDGELRFSRLYRTPPVGGPSGQGDFLNGIAALQSDYDVWSIWEAVKRVEAGLGRHRLHRWEARRIDVDILLHYPAYPYLKDAPTRKGDSTSETRENDCDAVSHLGSEAKPSSVDRVNAFRSENEKVQTVGCQFTEAKSGADRESGLEPRGEIGERIWTPHFKVPHPRMCMRSFMLIPALEVAADWIEPVSGWSLQKLANNLYSDKKIGVVCTHPDLPSLLESRIGSEQVRQGLEWFQISSPKELLDHYSTRTPLSERLSDCKLLIIAANNKDPETVQWEDWSRDWAIVLEMQTSQEPLSNHQLSFTGNSAAQSFNAASQTLLPLDVGPRYLLPASDVDWAAHEIVSAFEAMHCSIEVCE